jgi:FkbM family methyltransferase
MKTTVKYVLQVLFGFRNYLYYFSRYKIATLRNDRKEGDFFHFLDLIPKEGTVLDIGANIGIMTVHLAKEPKRKVIAFEPMPKNLEALNRILKHYKLSNVLVMPYALGSADGTVEMVMPMESGARMQGLSHVIHESISDNNRGEKITAELRALDGLKELQGKEAITGVKMDVENFEFFVLDGGRQMLSTHQPVLYIELWDNENRSRCFKLLGELGYSIHVVENSTLVKYDKQNKQNFIFLPSGK